MSSVVIRSSPRAATWRRAAVLVACVAAALVPVAARAQAYGYPSFQPPRVESREYNFGVAGVGDHGGTAFVFQWREGTSAKNQLSLDAGLASPSYRNASAMLLVGGQFAHQLTTATADMPFDILFTAGVGGAFGSDASLFRIPVGVSVGHRFPLDQGMSITPYVHPRIVIGGCSRCGDGYNNVALDFDLGGSFQINSQFAIRASAGFGGHEFLGGDSFGVSLAWTPPGLVRR